MRTGSSKGLVLAAGSGILYGLVNVLAKPIPMHPAWKTLLLYAASAAALSPFLSGLRIARRDWWRILAMGVLGGGVAPVLLFFGLERTAATDAGLLLTLEMVATAGLAALFLRERYPPLEVVGLGLLLATAATIAAASSQGGTQTTLAGAALVLGAAVAWGIDNTVSAHLVGNYRVPQLVAVKGIVGTLFAAGLLAAPRPPLPTLADAAAMAGLGIVSIAVSSVLFYNALRHVGAGRTSAMNIGTTAVVGAVGGAALLGESWTWLHLASFALLAAGATCLWLAGRRRGATGPPASPVAP